MISDEMRPLRDVLRTRLRLVERRVAAQNSIARLLEKHNVRDVADLDVLGQLQAETHIEQAELLHRQVKRLESALVPHLVPDADVQRLLSVPGIGKACAFSIRLEVDDIARFPSDRAFFSYCRLVPGADNSGDRVRHKRSRDGNRYLKLAFSHAAVRAIQYYPEVRAWYGTKKRRKPDVVARALVAKEIARIVYHMLRKQQDFNGQFKGVPLSRLKKELPARLGGAGPYSQARPAELATAETPVSDRPRREWEARPGPVPAQRAADRDLGRRAPSPSAVETDGESPFGGVARQRSAGGSPTDLETRRRRSTPSAPSATGCRARLPLHHRKRPT